MSKKTWQVLEIYTAEEASEAIEFALNELDALGTEINHLGKKADDEFFVSGYFNEKLDDEIIRRQVDEALNIYDFPPETAPKFVWSILDDENWLYEWRKYWSATETAKFVIAPTWEEVTLKEKTVIRIEPNMAFGTGTHATTQLCLKAVEDVFTPEMSFFDVGTGTGILAIAAAKMKAEGSRQKAESGTIEFNKSNSTEQTQHSPLTTHHLISACDTDEDSIRIARENAELNDVSDVIEFYVGSINEESPQFDFVCANVTIDVIVPLLPLLLEKSRSVLVLSGILTDQQEQIENELKNHGIEKTEIETQGEWISVLIRK